MFEHIKSLVHAGPAAKPAALTPKPAPAAPAPELVPISLPVPVAPAVESAPVAVAESHEPTVVPYEPEPVVAVKSSKEPTIVEYVPEPVVSAPKGTPLVDPTGTLRAYIMPDGTLVAVTAESEDSLAHLSEADRRPIDWAEEKLVTRADGTILPQRSPGRIQWLLRFETEQQTKDRIANDIHRALFARPRTEFDPETTRNAEAIKKWIQ